MQGDTTRREMLAASATVLTPGTHTIGARADPSPDEVYEQALRIQERTGDRRKFRRFLRNRGFVVNAGDATFSVPATQSDDIGARILDEADLEIGLSLSEYCSSYYAKTTWNWGDNDLDDIGDNPKDTVAMLWKEGAWFIPFSSGGDTYGGDFIANADSPTTSPTGVAMRYSDGNDLEVFGAGGAERYIATDLEPLDDSFEPSERQIWIAYEHAYGGGHIDDVDINGGALDVTYTIGHSGGEWQTGTDQQGNKVIVGEPDAEDFC